MSEVIPFFSKTWMPTYTRWLGITPTYKAAIAASDLPDSIKSTIGSLVKKTRLWRSEKYHLAQELIAHFQDGLVAGSDEKDLLTNFGDPVTSAKLIRKAKLRARPIVWHVWRWTLRGVFAIICLYI